MRRHGLRGVFAVKVPHTLRLQRVRVHGPRTRVLLQHKQLAAVPVRVCVGSGAIDLGDTRVVREAIAVNAEEALARLALRHQAVRANVTALVVDRTVRETEAADVTVAVEAGHPLVLGRAVIEVALHPIEGAFDVLGDLSPDFTVVHVALEARGTVEPGWKQRVSTKIDCHSPSKKHTVPDLLGPVARRISAVYGHRPQIVCPSTRTHHRVVI